LLQIKEIVDFEEEFGEHRIAAAKINGNLFYELQKRSSK